MCIRVDPHEFQSESYFKNITRSTPWYFQTTWNLDYFGSHSISTNFVCFWFIGIQTWWNIVRLWGWVIPLGRLNLVGGFIHWVLDYNGCMTCIFHELQDENPSERVRTSVGKFLWISKELLVVVLLIFQKQRTISSNSLKKKFRVKELSILANKCAWNQTLILTVLDDNNTLSSEE